jgi:hypothetical protein
MMSGGKYCTFIMRFYENGKDIRSPTPKQFFVGNFQKKQSAKAIFKQFPCDTPPKLSKIHKIGTAWPERRQGNSVK